MILFFTHWGGYRQVSLLLCFKILGRKNSPSDDEGLREQSHSNSSLMLIFNQCTFRKSSHSLSTFQLGYPPPLGSHNTLSIPILYNVSQCIIISCINTLVPPDCWGMNTKIMAYCFLYLTSSTWVNSTFTEHVLCYFYCLRQCLVHSRESN